MTGVGVSLPISGVLASCDRYSTHSMAFKNLITDLLKDWCDGMIRVQIHNPSNLQEHGALGCPSCDHIHGRCMDAVYPFMYMADVSGEKKYLEAAKLVIEWAENNVSQEDGAWTVVSNPKTWKGITVFGAIALAETLHYHSHVLDQNTRNAWTDRLAKAGQYIYNTFSISFTNINYGATAIYGLNLIGEVINNQEFKAKSKVLAEDVTAYFTANEGFLFGECKKSSNKLSAKGLHGVDLGYNVEESLNSLAMYALKENDEKLLELVTTSLDTHLEFMLPDGGWDNSWGTRMYKWTYWGSRTCDGSQPAYAMMAHKNPAFGTAVVKNTELLKSCTSDGLLHGGPGYIAAEIPPCVHHTFTHAKPLALLLNHWKHLPEINDATPLPREVADGVKYCKDLNVTLFARDDWRGTVSAYDAEYHYKNDYRQATGGSLGVLYHNKVGLLCAASLAVYQMVERYNQQPQPNEDFAITPRIETFDNNQWYTNLFDLTANVESLDRNNQIDITAAVKLKNEARETVGNTASDFTINYNCSENVLNISAITNQAITQPTAFILPIISPNSEVVTQVSETEITIQKPEVLVKVSANLPLKIKKLQSKRLFNMVPGVEVIPIEVFFTSQHQQIDLTISVS